jgi:uncharacterized protein
VPPEDVDVVALAAIAHDYEDYKYTESRGCGFVPLREVLTTAGVEADTVGDVFAIISGLGFHEELRQEEGGERKEGGRLHLLTAVVQDADRLDAMGAIGIARCLTFGGAKGRTLHDPAIPPRVALTAAAYMATSAGSGSGGKGTTVNHFYEKLLTLEGKMKTAPGRALAEGRHATLLAFLDDFHAEWEGER